MEVTDNKECEEAAEHIAKIKDWSYLNEDEDMTNQLIVEYVEIISNHTKEFVMSDNKDDKPDKCKFRIASNANQPAAVEATKNDNAADEQNRAVDKTRAKVPIIAGAAIKAVDVDFCQVSNKVDVHYLRKVSCTRNKNAINDDNAVDKSRAEVPNIARGAI